MKRAFFVFGYGFALACGGNTLPPAGQLVVHIGTDAPLPAAPGNPAPTVPPLFDRIRVSVYEPGAVQSATPMPCVGCVGDFSVNSTDMANGKVSFGVVLRTEVTGYVARLDMFRAAATELGDPIPRATVTKYISLPPIQTDGIIHVGAFLNVDDVGKPVGTLKAPVAALSSAPSYDRVGTWAGATRIPCNGAPKPGEACVPGGAYWMGNTALSDQRAPDQPTTPHLVVVPPFFYEATEVTVAAFRSSGLALLGPSPADPKLKASLDPVDGSLGWSIYDPEYFCTYTTDSAKNEALALNCVSWAKAVEYCASRGSDLPTEAQFEYAATGLASTLYVWGNDAPGCTDAVHARGGIGAFGASGNDCNLNGRNFGPRAPGSGGRDRLELGGATIFDLVGNVSEWTIDKWQRTTEPCWNSPILYNPRCSTVSAADGDKLAIRGGAWPTTQGECQSAQRNPKAGTARPQTGFRCARPGN
ncbi:hypothetical protein BH09MYX1_BH09MYX1_37870 [soil metagenome]